MPWPDTLVNQFLSRIVYFQLNWLILDLFQWQGTKLVHFLFNWSWNVSDVPGSFRSFQVHSGIATLLTLKNNYYCVHWKEFPPIVSFLYNQCTLRINCCTLKINQSIIKYLHIYHCTLLLDHISVQWKWISTNYKHDVWLVVRKPVNLFTHWFRRTGVSVHIDFQNWCPLKIN